MERCPEHGVAVMRRRKWRWFGDFSTAHVFICEDVDVGEWGRGK